MYQIRLLDSTFRLIHFTELSNKTAFQLRSSQSCIAKITIPYIDKIVPYLTPATYAEIWREDIKMFEGVITTRDMSNTEYIYEVSTYEEFFRRTKTPKNWGGWNKKDLADVVRDHLNKFKFKRWTTLGDWQSAQTLYQVDILTDEGSVFLQYEQNPNDIENERPRANGYIILRQDTGEKALTTGRFIRWAEVVGKTERITIQSRTSSTEGGLASASWSVEQTVVHAEEIVENETKGIVLVDGGRWIEVKINLYADDRETPQKDSSGNVVGYGFTPQLKGVEVVWRESIGILPGDIPASTGIIIEGYENIDRASFLKSICEVCMTNKWEYRIRRTGKALYLDLKESFGEDKSRYGENPVILKDKTNCKITMLRENREQFVNVLYCWGPGEGADQMCYEARDEESIAQLGEISDDFSYPEAKTYLELVEKGFEEFQKRSNPDVSFEVEVYLPRIGETVQLGDTITIIREDTGTVLEARVVQYDASFDTKSETVKLGLNSNIYNPLESFVIRKPALKNHLVPPNPPYQVTAVTDVMKITVQWRGDSDAYVVRYRNSDTSPWKTVNISGKAEFVHENLEPFALWTYQVLSVSSGGISEWSDPVSASAKQFPWDGIETPKPPEPKDPSAGPYVPPSTQIQMPGNTITWTPPAAGDNVRTAIIKRIKTDGTDELLFTTSAEGGKFVDTTKIEPGAQYFYSLQYINAAGSLSDVVDIPSAAVTPSATTTPSVPTGLNASISLNKIALRCNQGSDLGLAGYQWRYAVSSVSDPNQATVLPGNTNTNSFAGVYGQTYNFWVRSYTVVSGQTYTSAWNSLTNISLSQVVVSDLDANLFKLKIYKKYAGNTVELSESNIQTIHDGKNTSNYITVEANSEIIFSYPSEEKFDCVASKVVNGTISQISVSNDGVAYVPLNISSVDLGNGFKRYDFSWVKAKFLKVTLSSSASMQVYTLRPETIIYADKFVAGIINADIINIVAGNGGVTIGANGIEVINGKMTLKNEDDVVCIDGQSNMLKIIDSPTFRIEPNSSVGRTYDNINVKPAFMAFELITPYPGAESYVSNLVSAEVISVNQSIQISNLTSQAVTVKVYVFKEAAI